MSASETFVVETAARVLADLADLGTVWEQGLPHRVRELASLIDLEDDEDDAFRNKLDFEPKIAPKLTIQGGTGIIARGLGLR